MRRILEFLVVFAIALSFSACSLRPKIPAVDTNVSLANPVMVNDINESWWEEFNNSQLNELMSLALSKNSDLLLALNSLEQAKVQMDLAKLEFTPNVKGEASSIKSETSERSPQGRSTGTLTSIGAVLSWEIDLWGRVRNAARAGIAMYEASAMDVQNARLSIAASVANTYFSLIALSEQENILKESLASYEQTLEYRKAELESGYITELVYYQSKASVDSARSQLATLQDSLSKTRTALAILSGKDASFIAENNITIKGANYTIPSVPEGISADILERRADVGAALLRFKAANAQIGVARAAYFPQISLTAAFGYTSNDFERLLVSSAHTWQKGGSLVMPLFDFGRTASNVKLAWLDQNASMLEYDKTLKNALGEVKDALELRKNADFKLSAASDLEASGARVYELSKLRYEAGYSSHLELLDAQRQHLSARLELASSKAGLASSVVEVFKAFGGGFKNPKGLEKSLDETLKY